MPIVVYDIIAALILAYCAYTGYKTGFFLTLCNCVATLVAFAGAIFIAIQFSQAIADVVAILLQAPIEFFLESQLEAAMTSDMAALLAHLEDTALLGGFVEQMNLETQATVSAMATSIAAFVALQLTRILLFLASFILLLICWSILSRTLNLAFKLPILSGVNALAGLGVGLIQGVLIVFVVVWVLDHGILTSAELETTYLLHYFQGLNPVTLMETAMSKAASL